MKKMNKKYYIYGFIDSLISRLIHQPNLTFCINCIFTGFIFIILNLVIKKKAPINFEFIGSFFSFFFFYLLLIKFFSNKKKKSFQETLFEQFQYFEKDLKACFLFILLLIIFFYRYFLFGDQFTPANLYYAMPPGNSLSAKYSGPLLSDPIDAFLPEIYMLKEELKNEEIDFWNPYAGMGFSESSSIPSTLGYILNWLVLLLPNSVGFLAFTFFKLFIVLWGMYLLLGRFKLSFTARILGAITFAFSGTLMAWLLWPHTSVTVLVPLLFYFSDRLIEKYSTRDFLLSILVLTQMFYAGMPPYVAYFGYLLGFFVIYRSWSLYWNWIKSVKTIIQLLTVAAISGVLSFPYTAILFETILQNDYLSQRSLLYQSTYNWRILSQLIIANFKFVGAHYNESAMYLGICPFLSLFGAFFLQIKYKEIRFWFITSAIVILSIFTHVFDPLIKIIPFINTSLKVRIVVILMFTVSILFAFIADYFLNQKLSSKYLFLFILICLSVISVIRKVWFDDNLSIFILLIFSIIFIIQVFPQLLIKINNLLPVKSILFFLIICLDLFQFNIRYLPYIGRFDSSLPVTDSINFLQKETDYQRFTALGKWTIFPNSATRYQIFDIRAHGFSMTTTRMQSFIKGISVKAYDTPTRISFLRIDDPFLLSLSGVKYILANQQENIFKDYYSNTSKSNIKTNTEFFDGNELIQITKIPNSALNRIDLNFSTHKKNYSSESYQIFLSLKDIDNNQIIAKDSIDSSEIVDNEYIAFRFPKIIINPQNLYEILITTDAPESYSLTIGISNEKIDAENNQKAQLFYGTQKIDGFLSAKFINEHEDLSFKGQFKDGLYLYENQKALNRAYLSRNIRFVESEKIMETMLKEKDLSRVYVEKPVPGISNTGISKNETAIIKEYDHDSVVIEAQINEPALLVLSDSYDEEWNVLVNGKEKEVLLVNGIFRGVKLEGGHNDVLFYYRPAKMYQYIIVSISGLIILVLILLIHNHIRSKMVRGLQK